jgi:hypothetical protein
MTRFPGAGLTTRFWVKVAMMYSGAKSVSMSSTADRGKIWLTAVRMMIPHAGARITI